MLSYIGHRIIQLIPLLIAISIISFVIIQLPPGDYLTTYIAQLELSGNEVSEGTILALQRQYGLDKPMYTQYFIWIKNIVLHGDFGRSFTWNEPVRDVIGERLGLTILISIITLIFTWVVAIPIGIYSAVRQYSILDYVFTFIGFIGLALPNFLIALFVIYTVFVNTGGYNRAIFARICIGTLELPQANGYAPTNMGTNFNYWYSGNSRLDTSYAWNAVR